MARVERESFDIPDNFWRIGDRSSHLMNIGYELGNDKDFRNAREAFMKHYVSKGRVSMWSRPGMRFAALGLAGALVAGIVAPFVGSASTPKVSEEMLTRAKREVLQRPETLRALGVCATELQKRAEHTQAGDPGPTAEEYRRSAALADNAEVPCDPPEGSPYIVMIEVDDVEVPVSASSLVGTDNHPIGRSPIVAGPWLRH